MFSELDFQIKKSLEKNILPNFLLTDMFGDLCNAIRERHPLTLTDVIGSDPIHSTTYINRARLRYLEQFLKELQPTPVIGNLLFWVDVQTLFLPLVQTNMFSVALFEEIQVTVRKIFNQYLADKPKQPATVVSEDTKKDILSRILLYQGEPFSPHRYASLFRSAQDQVWKWMQTKIFPNFQNSVLYIQLVVEVEILENDDMLRKACSVFQQPTLLSLASQAALQMPASSPVQKSPLLVSICADQYPDQSLFFVESTICSSQYKRSCISTKLSQYHIQNVIVFSVGECQSQGEVKDDGCTVIVGDTKFIFSLDFFYGETDKHYDVKVLFLGS